MRQDNYPAGVTDATIEDHFADRRLPKGANCDGCAYCQRVWLPGGGQCMVCAWCLMHGDRESGLEMTGSTSVCDDWEAA